MNSVIAVDFMNFGHFLKYKIEYLREENQR